ncbi:carbohydrate kinase family protein [Stutzerimonas stutzeri]|uniref:Carbohydrate kinase family protein n=2 Tax=Pseudomonadaceae TaxID=135621 RepID=A0A427HR49_ECTOL|nr:MULTISPECIES: carbohydrate kinase family protein [Pseudomonadaceae]WAD25756.1 carbohydrate kinase family protein [Pseudomonadaceae bacterium T75]EMB2823441.1 carbohydrate kinase family protein [Pseudomonas aeruginosa]MBV5857917.1 carbohydrate kinase family protein [Pseudomonas aeruginosa]MCS9082134.1 carbohydrate kinase family protein [Pseudomonas aeruginosa]MCT0701748.1 carbohydrate kinase family protein [Pseudomonas aeruginosa]
MHIVGGFYRELCQLPEWDATMGSGARAALSVAALSPSTEFTTYAAASESMAVAEIERHGIAANVATRPSPIVFAYFHPLSSPHIEPGREKLITQPSLQVTANAVLRFGFLEGDAVVKARRAVYDPQTWRNPKPFSANGSSADELALVMNELEISSATGIENIDQAADHLIQTHKAEVVVVKQGPYGAKVYDASDSSSHVPAYRSTRVFKIGTGDVFSAVFAHYWAQMRIPARDAADLASRAVSLYCETRTFKFEHAALAARQPVFATRGATACIEAGIDAIGQRYALEEARFALRELGLNVICPNIEPAIPTGNYEAILVIDDALPPESVGRIAEHAARGTPIIVLKERAQKDTPWPAYTLTTPDFTTALYLTAWAAGEALSLGMP